MTEKATREAKDAVACAPALDAAPAVNAPSNLKFNITDCKLYVPVVTLQTKYENALYQKFLKNDN